MKKRTHLIVIIYCLISLVIFPAGVNAQTNNHKSMEGIWVGTLVIPNAAKLRMGITVSDSSNAALNIIDQATGDIPVDVVTYNEDSVTFKLNELGITITGAIDLEEGTITSEFKQGGGVFPIVFSRTHEMPRLKRPQVPKEPFPYSSEDIVYDNNEAGIKLAGTLTLPKSVNKVPAAILLTGSGQQGRDQDIGGHKPFWVIADYLSRNGIAVLRVDDRGFGGSTGNFKQSTSGDFAQDATAGVNYLKNRKEINESQIGLIGHSEGGTVAVIAASNSHSVAFVVSLAGPGIGFEEIVISQILGHLRTQGVNDDDLKLQQEWRRKIYAIAKEPTDSATAAQKLWDAHAQLSEEEVQRLNWPAGRHKHTIPQILNPWWRYYMALDIDSVLRRVDCPVLALYGQKDTQVKPNENSSSVKTALKEGENKNYTVKILPGLNHLFQTAETGSEYEYVQLEETFSPEILSLINSWIHTQTPN